MKITHARLEYNSWLKLISSRHVGTVDSQKATGKRLCKRARGHERLKGVGWYGDDGQKDVQAAPALQYTTKPKINLKLYLV
jgi:hypothetical protein